MAKRGTFIGRAYVSITGDDSALGKVLAGVRNKMRKLGDTMAKFGLKLMAIGTAITAPLTLAVQRFASLGDEMAKGAKRSGLTAAAYAELGHAAQLAGSSAARFERAMQGMARGLFDAKRGTGEMKDALRELGLSWRDFEKLDTEGKFLLLADRISMISDPTVKAAIAMKVFGRAGADLLPMFEGGAKGIELYRQEARRLGVSLGPEMAANAERLTDMFFRLRQSLRGITFVIGNILAPIFDKTLTYLTNLATNVRRWLQQNPKVIRGIWNVATALVAVGAGFFAIGKATKFLSALVSPGGLLLALGALLLVISGALDPLIKKWGKVVLDFEIGGRKIRDWLKFLAQAWGEFVDALKDIGAELLFVFKRVGPAIAATWDFVWETAKAGFLKFLRFLAEKFRDILADLAGVFAQRMKGASVLIKPLLSELRGLSAEGARAFARTVAKLRPREAGREERVEEARGRMGAAFRLLGAGAVGAGGRISDRVKLAVDRIGEIGSKALGPLLERIFGEKQKDKIETFLDIFTGLGKKFKEAQKAIVPALAPAATGRAATLVSGTFAGRAEAVRGAVRTNQLLNGILDATRKTNKVLDRRLTAAAWTEDPEPS